MAEQESALFAIAVDADDYAETAAGDSPAVSRTFQSEADFQAVKATYQAKVDGGNTYRDLIAAVPVLERNDVDEANGSEHNGTDLSGAEFTSGHTKTTLPKLGKKDFQLLTHAVGEMYYDKQYSRILELCDRVRERCEVDEKTAESLGRWERRCRERLG